MVGLSVHGNLGEEDVAEARHVDHLPVGVVGIAPLDLLYQRAKQVTPVIDLVNGLKPAITAFHPIRGMRVPSHFTTLVCCQLAHVLVMERGYLRFAFGGAVAFGGHGLARKRMQIQYGLYQLTVDTQVYELGTDERDDWDVADLWVLGRDLRHDFVGGDDFQKVDALDNGGGQGAPMAVLIASGYMGIRPLTMEDVIQVIGHGW